MEDIFDLENTSTETIEELNIRLRKEQEEEEEEIDLYPNVLDQIDEIAISAEHLKTQITKRKQKMSPSKNRRSIVRRILFQQRREQERNQQRKISK